MIKYITVDDETAAHDNILDYANNLPYLFHQKSCYNAFEAIDFLSHNSIDLIFLDINMPKLSGFEFLKSLPNPPRIIVTTAHKEFALQGYEFSIDDYLLKPFGLQRFISAINKTRNHLEQLKNTATSLFIKDNKKYYQVKFNQIIYAEAYGNYVNVHLDDNTIMTHQTLTAFEISLPIGDFIKVHKSFIVAKNKITLVEKNTLHLREFRVPIGKTYRKNINALLL